ncbi:MAG: aspartate aminotransferase family protein [Firmicutes bacterium]|nr:aspartate aminotransferase family protein [Bacillota bacterium]
MDYNSITEIDANYYMRTFNRMPAAFERGEGCLLYDVNGKEYLDFFAGIAVNALGYNDKEFVAAVADQVGKLIHTSNIFYSPVQARFIKTLLAGSDFNRVFLSNSGAEANECAIKIVRKAANAEQNGKTTVITALKSFHGRTVTTATATGQPKYAQPFAPLTPGFKYVPYNDCAALKEAVTDDVGAIMLENILGESGIFPADYEFINTAYVLAKSKGLFLIFDEIQTGVGRTGKFFGYEHYDIVPDIVTLAKGIAGGIPMGATLARGIAADTLKPGEHGSTFGGNALACRAADVVVARIKTPAFLADVARKGTYLIHELTELKSLPCVKDVRGRGLMAGLELAEPVKNSDIATKMLEKGFVINAAGSNTLRFCPPLVITEGQINQMITALKDILDNH